MLHDTRIILHDFFVTYFISQKCVMWCITSYYKKVLHCVIVMNERSNLEEIISIECSIQTFLRNCSDRMFKPNVFKKLFQNVRVNFLKKLFQ